MKDKNEIIKFSDVSFCHHKTTILKGVNFTINQSDFCCIVGQNGSGKSTLIKLMAGILSPTSGEIKLFGENAKHNSNLLGYLPQNIQYDVSFPISILDVVLMGRQRSNFFSRYREEDYVQAMNALKKVEMDTLSSQQFSDLSGGQQQRVLIARAIVTNPKILLFDEPTASVDTMVENKILDLLNELSKDMAIIIVSHNIRFVADLVEKVICVDNKSVAIHHAEKINNKLIDAFSLGHFKVINHDHCDHSGDS